MAENINDLIWAGIGIIVNTAPQWIIILVPFRKKLNMKFGFVFAGCSLLVLLCAVGFALFPPELQTFSTLQGWIMAFLLPSLAFFLWVLNEKKSKLMYLFIIIAGIVIAISKTANFTTLYLFDNPGFFHFAVVHTVSRLITTPLLIIYIDRLIKRTLPIVESSGNKLWKIIWIIPAIFMLINLLYNPGFDPAVIMQPTFMITNILVVVGTVLSSSVLVLTLQIVSETADAKKEKSTLERVNHLKTELMRTVSHEMRTPLAVMLGFAQLSAEDVRKKGMGEDTAAIFDTIADEARRLNILLEELSSPIYIKEFSKDRREISADVVINKIAALYEVVLERKNIALRLELPEGLPDIYGNEYELTQVIFNLLRNAEKHTDSGTITISAQAAGEGEITIAVTDTGAGISPELLPQVFEHGISGEKGGMGFGLAICREIVQAHGKRIWIDSELDKGTSVSFTMPIYNTEKTRGDNHVG